MTGPGGGADDFEVRFRARPLESFRGPWADLEDVFHDPGVALDFVGHLDPTYGPTVVRAEVFGGSDKDRAAIDGDWLCGDTANRNTNERVPRPAWSRDERALLWSSSRPMLDAWEKCHDARWMVHAAALQLADLRPVKIAVCACVRTVSDLINPRGDVAAALVATWRWAAGEVAEDELREAARRGAQEAAQQADSVTLSACNAAIAAADLAVMATGRRIDAEAQAVASFAAGAVDRAYRAAYLAGHRRSEDADGTPLPDVVRRHIPTILMLRVTRLTDG